MGRPRIDCPICKGKGWAEEPYYSDFAPCTRPVPCRCTRREPTTTTVITIALLVAAMVMVIRWIWLN